MPEAAPAALSEFLARVTGDSDGRAEMSLLSGGRSNLTYAVCFAGRDLVLRRPPLEAGGTPGHDVAREHRILAALSPAGVRAPKPLAYCEDATVLGVPFYVMERVAGRALARLEDAPDLDEPERLRLLAPEVVAGLAELHEVRPEAVGLADLGDAAGYAARQVRRWVRQWTDRAYRPIPALDEIGRRLQEVLAMESVAVAPERACLIHGDYNLGNLLVANSSEWRRGELLRAILDWEMSTLGNPLIDLGLLAAYNGPLGHLILEQDGMVWQRHGWPPVDDLVGAYARASGRDTSAFDFFYVLAWFKMVVITEELRARHLAGLSRGEGHSDLGRSAPVIAEAVLEHASRSSIAGLNGRS